MVESDEWIMNSGYTYHMCPNREWYSSIKMLAEGSVFMGNDHAYKTLGIGKVRYLIVQRLSCDDRRWSVEGYQGCYDCDDGYMIE